MTTIHTCDRCGTTIHHGEMWTVTEKRVGAAAERKHLLCGSCLAIVAAAIHMAIDVAKRELRGDAEYAEGGTVSETYIDGGESGSICPIPRANVIFEGQKMTFDDEDSAKFAELVRGHFRKLAGLRGDA